MLLNRQKILLTLLDVLGGNVGNLDFQKLLFLYCQEEENPTYEFVPYKYGGFSFTSYADKRQLIGKGLLVDEENIWKATSSGQQAAIITSSIRRKILQFAKRYERIRGEKLVKIAYQLYPYYTMRSEIVDRVLAGDLAAANAVKVARPVSHNPGLFTIGYEGRTLENYLNKLLKSGITLVCDVRNNPFSRKYGFSKNTLSKSCAFVEIRYEHLPELGVPSDKRQGLKTQADYDELFDQYTRNILPLQIPSITRIRDWVNEGECVALTCYEQMPSHCHRHCIADFLTKEFGHAFSPRHL